MYPNKAQQQVVDMFMDIKKRLDQVQQSLHHQQSQSFLSKILPFDEDRNSLMEQESVVLLQYIKQVVIYLVKTKLELEDKRHCDQPSEYESLIQKLEADIRQHIRVEQQLRLYAESTQQKYDDLLSEKKQLSQHIQNLEGRLADLEVIKTKTEGAESIHRYKIPSCTKLTDVTNKSKTITEPLEQKKPDMSQSQSEAFENKLNSFGAKKRSTIDDYKNQVPSVLRSANPSVEHSLIQSQQPKVPITKLHTSHASSPLSKKAPIDKSRNSFKQEVKYTESNKQSIINASQSSIHQSQGQLGYRSYSMEQQALGLTQQSQYRLNFLQQQ